MELCKAVTSTRLKTTGQGEGGEAGDESSSRWPSCDLHARRSAPTLQKISCKRCSPSRSAYAERPVLHANLNCGRGAMD